MYNLFEMFVNEVSYANIKNGKFTKVLRKQM